MLGVPGLFLSWKRDSEMSVEGTECNELCGVMYVYNLMFLNHMQENKGVV